MYQNAQACEVDDPSNCAETSVAITIDIYNVKAPEFNHPYAHGQIDLGSCPEEGQCELLVVLDKTIEADDGDGEICFVKTSLQLCDSYEAINCFILKKSINC